VVYSVTLCVISILFFDTNQRKTKLCVQYTRGTHLSL